ncbi:hypothetical protein U1Q18_036106, partial [Sarracenia purpurea var. burkii]
RNPASARQSSGTRQSSDARQSSGARQSSDVGEDSGVVFGASFSKQWIRIWFGARRKMTQ